MTVGGAGAGAAKIDAAFAVAREEGRAALMPYMMGGFPDQETSMAIADAYVDGGADLIELGVPFSDPLADGPVIHAAATAALEAGARLESVLEICRRASDRVPVVLMAYSNMVLGSDGPAGFAARASEAGASGVIVPDLPLGEDEDAKKGARRGRPGRDPARGPDHARPAPGTDLRSGDRLRLCRLQRRHDR